MTSEEKSYKFLEYMKKLNDSRFPVIDMYGAEVIDVNPLYINEYCGLRERFFRSNFSEAGTLRLSYSETVQTDKKAISPCPFCLVKTLALPLGDEAVLVRCTACTVRTSKSLRKNSAGARSSHLCPIYPDDEVRQSDNYEKRLKI